MRTRSRLAGCALLFAAEVMLGFAEITAGGQEQKRKLDEVPLRPPNIILILTDGLGWNELGSYGNAFNKTPNLDRLAEQGARFAQGYAAAPAGRAARAAILAGQAPARVGIVNVLEANDGWFLSHERVTLNEALKPKDYVTGLIGKWGLTSDSDKKQGEPALHGWDEVILVETRPIGAGDAFHPYEHIPDARARSEGEYLTERLNQEAVDFVRRHRREPFFLLLSHYAPNSLAAGKPEKVKKYQAKAGAGKDGNNPELAAKLESIDEGVGAILEVLDEWNLAKETVVIFTSVYAGEQAGDPSAPLREGGIRVPLIVWWPAVVRARRTIETPVMGTDLLPTMLEIGEVKTRPDQPMDGVSWMPLLRGRGSMPRRNLYWHCPVEKPNPHSAGASGAARQADWKLIEYYGTGEVELYDLKTDAGERNNLAEENRSKAAELRKLLADWRQQTRPAEPARVIP